MSRTLNWLRLATWIPDSFRKWGHRIIDWIADYLEHPEQYPVLSRVEPGAIRSQLAALPPDCPEPMSAILDDVEKIIVPGLTHWNHPAFMAYFGITGSGPGILGELLSAAFNVNAMLWKTSPAATELEEVVLDWLRQMIGLPAGFSGIIYDTASVSTMHAIAAAREAVPGLNSARTGVVRPTGCSATATLHFRAGTFLRRKGGDHVGNRAGRREENPG